MSAVQGTGDGGVGTAVARGGGSRRGRLSS